MLLSPSSIIWYRHKGLW